MAKRQSLLICTLSILTSLSSTREYLWQTKACGQLPPSPQYACHFQSHSLRFSTWIPALWRVVWSGHSLAAAHSISDSDASIGGDLSSAATRMTKIQRWNFAFRLGKTGAKYLFLSCLLSRGCTRVDLLCWLKIKFGSLSKLPWSGREPDKNFTLFLAQVCYNTRRAFLQKAIQVVCI